MVETGCRTSDVGRKLQRTRVRRVQHVRSSTSRLLKAGPQWNLWRKCCTSHLHYNIHVLPPRYSHDSKGSLLQDPFCTASISFAQFNESFTTSAAKVSPRIRKPWMSVL
jgi:hypothetical protein